MVRAKIVLLAADGEGNAVIARRLDVHVGVVSKWRKRFAEQGLGGLADRKRPGRPRVFTAAVVAQVKAMACEPPAVQEVPLSSSAELAGQVEFEYERHGTLAYVAAYDVHRAQLMGAVAPTTGIAPFSEVVRRVMTSEPYVSARRVFWVVDNGSSHAGQASIRRMEKAWPTATLVRLPVHASWLNQIEVVFSVIQRKVIKPADFADLDALAARLLAFAPHYNVTARPFDWRFTHADLHDLLARISAREAAGALRLAA